MKKFRKRGLLDARHQSKRFELLAQDARKHKAGIIAGALLGAIIAAAIGGLFMFAGGQ